MLNKLSAFIRSYDMLQPGDRLVCAVSGGADSMALLWAMYLLKDKLDIRLSAAHFNHGLRGAESDRDEAFVRDFCEGMGIPFHRGNAAVTAGKKGLEAAARDARYAFLRRLPGKIATAHTANDNAETVLMHLVRGTGLKGLGAIAPVSGTLIRPMLSVTREEVLGFLEEYHIPYVTDSSNETDAFLRNRLRRHVIPLLEQENPRLAENLSAMALRLREDEAALAEPATDSVEALRGMNPAQRSRALAAFLESCGVKEPAAEHISLAESLVFSDKPSARASFPGGVTVCRNYARLERVQEEERIPCTPLACPGATELPELKIRIECAFTRQSAADKDRFTVVPQGQLVVRSRQSGDSIRLSGGTKSLKKLFIDKKIPAAQRMRIPVIADDGGIVGVYGFGPDLDRFSPEGEAIEIKIVPLNKQI